MRGIEIFILLSIILLSGCNTDINITLSNLSGKWIDQSNGFLEVGDTTSNTNYRGENVGMMGKYLEIRGDTLSFQNRYSSSEDNHSTKRIEKSDFKVISLSKKYLTITPLTESAAKLFKTDTINLTKQQFAVNEHIIFEKIVFHTTHCFGHCPVYHLEVLRDGRTRLHKERIYKKKSIRVMKVILQTLDIIRGKYQLIY